MNPEILITGATGTTSQLVIQHLVKKNVKVRAMVHTLDERSEALKASGVEVFQGDFLDLNSLRAALEGIKKAYFCYPFKNYLPKAAGYFAKAARENGTELVVAMSQMNVHEGSSSPATQNHMIAEEILDWAGIGAVHIRPALFAWNYLSMAGATVATEGKFYFPLPEAQYTIVHPEDIAEAVVQILLSEDPANHIGQRYLLSGGELFTGSKVASLIGEVTGKEIEYIPIPVEVWTEAMKKDPYINDFLAEHLSEFSKDIAAGRFTIVNNTVKELTGHPPRTFREYLEGHKAVFVN